MPAKSQQQYKFMQAISNGSIKGSGMTNSQAAEYIAKNKGRLAPHNLPRISSMMKNKKGQ
jgi:hypothetical protein